MNAPESFAPFLVLEGEKKLVPIILFQLCILRYLYPLFTLMYADTYCFSFIRHKFLFDVAVVDSKWPKETSRVRLIEGC